MPSPRRFPLLAAALLILGLVALPAGAAPDPDAAGRGNDISWPQCHSDGHGGRTADPVALPADSAFGIVGTQFGKPNTANPCLNREWTWALGRPTPPMLYLLTGNPGPDLCATPKTRQLPQSECDRWVQGSLADPAAPPQPCSGDEADNGCAYDYGYQAGLNALANADAAQVTAVPTVWWIDVEPKDYFRTEPNRKAQNVIALMGTRDALLTRSTDRVSRVGIYASPGEWDAITGKDRTTFASLPHWYPVGHDTPDVALSKCAGPAPTGGVVELVQWVDRDETLGIDVDADLSCTARLAITSLPFSVPTGAVAAVAGTAPPGTALSITSGEVGVAEHVVATPVVDGNGQWSAQFSLHTNGFLSVKDSQGGNLYRRVSVSTGVGITKIRGVGYTAAGQCRVRLDGGVNPWVPGQVALVKNGTKVLGFAHTRKRGGTTGSWAMVLNLRCGKRVVATPELPGKVGKVTYALTSRGTPRLLKPR